MANTYVSDYNAQLPATQTVLVSAAPNETKLILRATITNDTTTTVTFTLYKVPAGTTTPSEIHLAANAVPIGSKETKEIWQIQGHVLAGGESYNGFASVADQLTCQIDTMKVV